jgi:hypothetical protein
LTKHETTSGNSSDSAIGRPIDVDVTPKYLNQIYDHQEQSQIPDDPLGGKHLYARKY